MTEERRSETYFATYRERQHDEGEAGLLEGLVIRPATVEDAKGLAALFCEREGGDPEQQCVRFLNQIRQDPEWKQRGIFVAEHGDTLVGFGSVFYFQMQEAAPINSAPSGWYLAGLIITPNFRRRGIGANLTRQRLDWIAARATEAFYFVNARNPASIALHTHFGFEEVTRDFVYPGVTFSGGVGILYRISLA